MAHKTLISGTSYDISGGKALVDGTSYSVKNGKVLIGGTAYDISFMLPPAVLDLWSGADATINSIIYVNGYWIVGGNYNDGTASYARIAYATELNGTWTTKDLWSTSSGSGSYIYDIAYGNGYWAVCGEFDRKGKIAWATDPTSSWATYDLWSADLQPVYCIEYGNGYWAIGGLSSTSSRFYGRLAYTPDITNYYGTSATVWATKNLWSNVNYDCPIEHASYSPESQKWYFSGRNPKSSTGDPYATYSIWNADITTQHVSATTLWNDTNTAYARDIIYENGYLVTVGKKAGEVRIAYSTDPTTSALATYTKTLWTGGSAIALVHKNGYWVVLGTYSDGSGTYHNRIAYATTPDGEWTIVDFWSGTDTSYLNMYDIEYGNGFWSVVGRIGTSPEIAHLSYTPNLDSLIW